MTIWWLAINARERHCYYCDLKQRRAIAQGWPDIGDVGYIQRMPLPHVEDELRRKLSEAYDDFGESLPRRLTNFFRCIEPGDLVIGIEGTTARGICRVTTMLEYRHEPQFNYAHALGPVEWIDWEAVSPGWRPKAPAKLLAVARVVNEAGKIGQVAERL